MLPWIVCSASHAQASVLGNEVLHALSVASQQCAERHGRVAQHEAPCNLAYLHQERRVVLVQHKDVHDAEPAAAAIAKAVLECGELLVQCSCNLALRSIAKALKFESLMRSSS